MDRHGIYQSGNGGIDFDKMNQVLSAKDQKKLIEKPVKKAKKSLKKTDKEDSEPEEILTFKEKLAKFTKIESAFFNKKKDTPSKREQPQQRYERIKKEFGQFQRDLDLMNQDNGPVVEKLKELEGKFMEFTRQGEVSEMLDPNYQSLAFLREDTQEGINRGFLQRVQAQYQQPSHLQIFHSLYRKEKPEQGKEPGIVYEVSLSRRNQEIKILLKRQELQKRLEALEKRIGLSNSQKSAEKVNITYDQTTLMEQMDFLETQFSVLDKDKSKELSDQVKKATATAQQIKKQPQKYNIYLVIRSTYPEFPLQYCVYRLSTLRISQTSIRTEGNRQSGQSIEWNQ